MRVSSILSSKGSTVATTAPSASLAEAVNELRLRGVGALVVSTDGRGIEGILSERDIVRRLAERGESILHEPVSAAMTTEVVTCQPDDDLERLARRMTETRCRHLPVIVDQQLVGIISIGDVVKARLEQLEEETRQMQEYITTGR
ncbi:CBS domain-containing protein [Dermatobacter hominis]|uniref:CBS domain-containing protein n=1 Tax=Dermatobacter hominis TaxID=2884263 RepID=UPI001D0FD5D1|nr:CBS domain-containing protein [Dermatobacter hominis]UDY35403.1 CBS domain-containing protein [Dermatobacter hominis]